jgi:agmatine deiminase
MTPRRMPGEFEAHERTVLCWPARHEMYGAMFAAAEDAHAEVARTIARFEPVSVVVTPDAAGRAREMVAGAHTHPIELVELAIDDSWFRDSGPTYVVDDERRVALDWMFNAWGEKFHPYDADAAVARRWAQHAGHEVESIAVVLEGGAIAVDGAGTLVTTEQCLLHPTRNPSMTRTDIEAVLRSRLGVEVIIWLPYGLALDHDTDGHVDNLAAFARPGRLVMQGCDDPSEDDWLRCNVNVRAARGTIDARGEAVTVIEIPVLPFADVLGQRVVVPYLNYYVGNGFVLVPVCGHPADDDMLAIISDEHPGREVVPLAVGEVLAFGGGGIHCITQQVPAAPVRSVGG